MISSLCAVLMAPVLYTAIGLPWARRLGFQRASRAAPLLGVFAFGFGGEVALLSGLPPFAAALLVVGVSAVLWSLDRRIPGRDELGELGLAYAVAVVATAASPFPILGNWAGDWFHAFDAGRAVLHGGFGAAHLARPPLFGAAMAPLALTLTEFHAFQAMSAVASAGAVLATVELAERFGAERSPRLMLPLLWSIFFLHHTAAAWPKLLAAGFVALSIARIDHDRPFQWSAAAAMACAVAVHEGAVVWIPLWILLSARGRSAKQIAAPLLALACFGLLLVGPYVAWSLWRFGLAARVAANPVVTDRSQDGQLLKVLMLTLSTVVGWSPLTNAARWATGPAPFSGSVVAKESWWLITSCITVSAGTMLGVMLPWLLTLRGEWSRLTKAIGAERAFWAIGIAVATVATGVLTPFYSDDGSMQVGHVPFALVFFALAMAATPPERVRRWIRLTVALGAGPWLLFQAGVTAGLRYSRSFEERFWAGSEGDYPRVAGEQLISVGMATFPVLLIAAVSVALWLAPPRRG